MRTRAAIALCSALLVGAGAAAEERPVDVSKDDWLNGPAVRLYPTGGPVRPYVVGAGGLHVDPRHGDAAALPPRFSSRQYNGRAGGGLELQALPGTALRLEGSTDVIPDERTRERGTTFGARIELRF
jgi:hypothetical protein